MGPTQNRTELFSPVHSWSFHPYHSSRFDCLLLWQLCCSGLGFKWRSNFSSYCDGRMHKACHLNSHIPLSKFSCHAWVNTVNCQLFNSTKPASDLHLIFLLLWRIMWPVQMSSSPSILGRLGNSPNSLLLLRSEVSLHLYLTEIKLVLTESGTWGWPIRVHSMPHPLDMPLSHKSHRPQISSTLSQLGVCSALWDTSRPDHYFCPLTKDLEEQSVRMRVIVGSYKLRT